MHESLPQRANIHPQVQNRVFIFPDDKRNFEYEGGVDCRQPLTRKEKRRIFWERVLYNYLLFGKLRKTAWTKSQNYSLSHKQAKKLRIK